MGLLLAFSRGVDWVSDKFGRVADWCILLACAISAGNAVVRYAIDWSSNALLEIQWYLFSAIFLLAAAYVLKRNEHIRIDIIAGRLSPRAQNWIDVFGIVVFLFPMVIMAMTIERMSVAWDERGAGTAIREGVGTLVVAALAYLVMSWQPLEHLVFVFPEVLLVLFAMALLLGRYSGYRLNELLRFRALAREPAPTSSRPERARTPSFLTPGRARALLPRPMARCPSRA